ncbi:MAG TPA: DUF1269 domain-containing protein [Anaerolineae bacterium]
MSTLIVVGFKKDKFRASEVLNDLVEKDYAWTIDLEDAVAAYRDYNGKLRIDASYLMPTGEEAAFGGLFGSLVGLTLGAIAVPVTAGASAAAAAGIVMAGALGGGALGAAGGVLDAKWWKQDFGISDDFVQQVGALVQPGDSAVYALLRTADPAIVAAKFGDYGGVVLSTTLSPEQARQIQAVVSGKTNFNPAGISPQTKKEEPMKTWSEMEQQVETKLRAWAQALDKMEAEEDALDAELDARMKASEAKMKSNLKALTAEMHADMDADIAQLQKDMNALSDWINATAARLDAENEKATGKAKADLEARQAKMRDDRAKVNAQLKASYQAEVKHIQNQIAQMRLWAQTTDTKNRAKLSAQLDALHQKADNVEAQVQKLHAEQVATWNENKAKVERALADLKQGRDQAMAELTEASEKAKAEFEKPA